jgi:predicted TIM-barrel enzyme
MLELDVATSTGGFPEPFSANSVLSAALLESLCSISAECEFLHSATLHYSLTKHVHAIVESVNAFAVEITGSRCGRA